MAIKYAVGAPISMMDELCPLGQIELCFTHQLLDKFSKYKQYYFDAKKKGKFIILDNGIMELGYSMTTEDLLTVSSELEPNLVTPPEILNDGHSTLKLTHEFIKTFEKSGLYPSTKILGVSHGATLKYWCNSFQELLQIPQVGRIGVPYDVPFDVFTSTKDKKKILEKFVIRRVELCQWIADNYPNSSIHLLGLAHPSELPFQVKHKFIESIDTSLPVMSAINGIRYEISDFGVYQKKVLDIELPYNADHIAKASHNISIMTNHWLNQIKS